MTIEYPPRYVMKSHHPARHRTLARPTGTRISSPSIRIHQLLLSTLLLVLLASPRIAACTQFVIYTFSGEMTLVDPATNEQIPGEGLEVTGQVSFYVDADLLPPPDIGLHEWHEYHPSGRLRMTTGETTWSNLDGGAACWVWMRIGQPWIRFVCMELAGPIPGMRVMMNFDFPWPYDNALYEAPYPEGPFSPDNFRDLGASGGFIMFNRDGLYGGASVDLLDVQFIDEPAGASLFLISGLALVLSRPRSRGCPKGRSTQA